jgi:hypothetical protein
MMRRGRLVLAMMLFGLVPQVGLAAGREESERQSLVGLRGVGVQVVVQCPSEEFTRFVTEDLLKTRVELKLRQSDVKVLSEAEWAADPRMPTLDVVVLAVDGPAETGVGPLSYAIYLSVAVNQRLWVAEGGTVKRAVFADSWSTSYVLYKGRDSLAKGSLNTDLTDLMDQFLNAWLATHGK